MATPLATIKRGDARTLRWALNADVTGATLRFLTRPSTNPQATATELTATLETVTNGVSTVAVALTAGDTATPGLFNCEVEATSGDVVQTFPSNGYSHLLIVADLG